MQIHLGNSLIPETSPRWDVIHKNASCTVKKDPEPWPTIFKTLLSKWKCFTVKVSQLPIDPRNSENFSTSNNLWYMVSILKPKYYQDRLIATQPFVQPGFWLVFIILYTHRIIQHKDTVYYIQSTCYNKVQITNNLPSYIHNYYMHNNIMMYRMQRNFDIKKFDEFDESV